MGMRPDKHHYFMNIAKVVATRSTCLRRAVGCVLVDELGHILATGHNGVPRGMPHCNEVTGFNFVYDNGVDKSKPLTGQSTGQKDVYGSACPSHDAPSGQNLDGCRAVHAECNSCLQCADVNKIHACYTTTSPCVACIKMLMNTGCKAIFFNEEYPHPEAKEMWPGSWTRLDC